MHTVELWPLEELTLGRAEAEDDIYKATRLDRKLHPGEPWSLCRAKKMKTHNEVPALWDGWRAIVSPNWMALLGWKMSFLILQGLRELQQVLPTILNKILAEWILFSSSGLCIPSWDSNQIWFVLSMRWETGVWPCFKSLSKKVRSTGGGSRVLPAEQTATALTWRSPQWPEQNSNHVWENIKFNSLEN